jgi:DNA-binding transcriptional MocR family regulator
VKRKRKSSGPFVMLPLRILNAPAWRVMSPAARLLWIELRRKLANHGTNNGKIYLSDRDAAKAIGVNKNTVVRAYAELEDYGFLRKTTGAYLGIDGHGIAPHYRFTDLAHGTHPATLDYEKWDGAISDRTPEKPGPKK